MIRFQAYKLLGSWLYAFGDSLFNNCEIVAPSKKRTQYFQTRVLKPYHIYDQCGSKNPTLLRLLIPI